MERIDLELVNLKHQKPTKVAYCFIELHDEYLRYAYNFKADEAVDKEEKEPLIWEPEINTTDTIALKNKISGIEKYWCTLNKKWAIYLMITGFGTDLRCFFESHEKTEIVFNKIKEWLIK